MKKLVLLPLFAMFCAGAKAQDSTALYQNFNNCDSTLTSTSGVYDHFPPGWSAYDVTGAQDWKCESEYGVNNTACMHINGYALSTNYQNENWLIAPLLNLSGYAGNVYLNFAATYYYAGDSLHVMVSSNYTAGSDPSTTGTWTELAHSGVMLYDTFYEEVGTYDYFQCDLTPYKSTPVYVAFKYTSSTTDGSAWDLDSVTTSGGTSAISKVTNAILPLKVLGISTSNEINLAYDVVPGQYQLSIFDMVGRKVYAENIISQGGNQNVTINNANLVNGMYILKVNNEITSGVTKFVVQ